MPIWKITPNGPLKVAVTKPSQEKLLEQHLEDWICMDPSLLDEPLLIIGRQVIIPDVKDRLDILALDPQGRAVIVELKRGQLKDPVDMQALRYASYISKWAFQDFEKQARSYLGAGDPDFNFNAKYGQFCIDAGVDEVPDVNSDQRIILVGSEVKDKLGSVALWLHEHNINIKVIEVEVYKEGDAVLVRPDTIIPLPVSRFSKTGAVSAGTTGTGQPWMTDGRTWHLDEQCNSITREILLRLDAIVRESFDVDGPRWNQKNYVAYRVGNKNWLSIRTHATVLGLRFLVKAGAFSQPELAKRLEVEEFDTEDTFAEKINLPSSVGVRNYNEGTDRVTLRIKQGFDLDSPAFKTFLADAYKAFHK